MCCSEAHGPAGSTVRAAEQAPSSRRACSVLSGPANQEVVLGEAGQTVGLQNLSLARGIMRRR